MGGRLARLECVGGAENTIMSLKTTLKPGQQVTVTVSKDPTNLSAGKTLARIWLFNDATKRFADKHKNPILEYRGWGGRVKPVRTRGTVLRKPLKGSSTSFRLTTARIADLASVERFVTVATAG